MSENTPVATAEVPARYAREIEERQRIIDQSTLQFAYMLGPYCTEEILEVEREQTQQQTLGEAIA